MRERSETDGGGGVRGQTHVSEKNLTLHICFFILISTKNATKHSKMTHKFGSNMNSHMQEWGGGLNQIVRMVCPWGSGL